MIIATVSAGEHTGCLHNTRRFTLKDWQGCSSFSGHYHVEVWKPGHVRMRLYGLEHDRLGHKLTPDQARSLGTALLKAAENAYTNMLMVRPAPEAEVAS